MLKGLWKLTWVETKVFLREPLGVFGTLFIPVIVFVVLGRIEGPPSGAGPNGAPSEAPFNLAIFAALLLAISAASSLVAIVAIYREGGILKRLRATPLSPVTILGSHVVVKLLFTGVGLGLLVLAGRQLLPGALDVNVPSFTAAVLLSTLSILSVGFVIAGIVPTARFGRPLSAVILYPMLVVSGLFFPVEVFSPPVRAVVSLFPTTQAVALMEGIWDGAGWSLGSAVALVAVFAVCTGLSSAVFRWE
ncbi:MAG: ABC transporter permease [Longimicrobiales bacterium]